MSRAVVSSWRSSSLTRVRRCSASKAGSASGVTIHGPMLPERAKFLPCVTLNLPWRTQSRIVPSFMIVSPATCSRARACGMRRPSLPMTITTSPS
jgi:hypothetical protein